MNELQNFLFNLNKLEELSFKKFNSSDFAFVNKKLDDIINDFKIKLENNEIDLRNKENKIIFSQIISKIEYIEQKISPKAELLDTFSKYTV